MSRYAPIQRMHSFLGSLEAVERQYWAKGPGEPIASLDIMEPHTTKWTMDHTSKLVSLYQNITDGQHIKWVNVKVRVRSIPEIPRCLGRLMDVIEHLEFVVDEPEDGVSLCYYQANTRGTDRYVRKLELNTKAGMEYLVSALGSAMRFRKLSHLSAVQYVREWVGYGRDTTPQEVIGQLRRMIRENEETLTVLKLDHFTAEEMTNILLPAASPGGGGAGRIHTLDLTPRKDRALSDEALDSLYQVIAARAMVELHMRMDLGNMPHLLSLIHPLGLSSIWARWCKQIEKDEADTFIEFALSTPSLRIIHIVDYHRQPKVSICTRKYMEHKLLWHPKLTSLQIDGKISPIIYSGRRARANIIAAIATGIQLRGSKPYSPNRPYTMLPMDILRRARDTLGYWVRKEDRMSCEMCNYKGPNMYGYDN